MEPYMTFAQILDAYQFSSHWDDLQPSSKIAYRKPIERLSALAKEWESYANAGSPKRSPVALPSKNEWNRLIRALAVSDNEKNKLFIVLNSIYAGAELPRMEFKALEHTVEETEPWMKDEVEALWKTALPIKERIAVAFLRFCFFTGLRPWCEAAVLEKHCVSTMVHVMGSKRREKGKVARVVPILPETKECLEFMSQMVPFGSLQLVFVNDLGRPLNKTWVAKHLERACETAGVECKQMYDARRGLGTAMLRSGYSLPDVANLFGHKDLKTTAKYDQRKMEEKVLNYRGV
jgi:integrase